MPQLSFEGKLRVLPTAARSGSEVNLQVAWELVRPGLHPGMADAYTRGYPSCSPGVSAVEAGHAHLLPWLVANCCPLDPGETLCAVAQHCNLVALQQAWRLLRVRCGGDDVAPGLMCAAARSCTLDTAAKLQWLLRPEQGGQLQPEVATAAVRAGSLLALRWLRSRCCPVDRAEVVEAALGHASLEVVQWVVRQGWGDLARLRRTRGARLLQRLAAGSAVEGAAKLEWLEARGQPLDAQEALRAAVGADDLRTARYLVERRGALLHSFLAAVPAVCWSAAAARLGGATVRFLAEHGLRGGGARYLVTQAARLGDLELVRWLVGRGCLGADQGGTASETGWGGCDLALLCVKLWPGLGCGRSGDEEACVEALRALAGAAEGLAGQCCPAAACVAASRGSLTLLRHLHEQLGAALTEEVLRAAAQGGCEAVLRYCVEQQRLAVGGQHLRLAAANGDLSTVRLLRGWGAAWPRDLVDALDLAVTTLTQQHGAAAEAAGMRLVAAGAAALVGEDAAAFDVNKQSVQSWSYFMAVLTVVLGALYALWIAPSPIGLGDKYLHGVEDLVGGNSEATIAAMLFIFAIAHSGLAGLRPYAEEVVGARAWRVVFGVVSLPLAVSSIVYFINHRYDGVALWNLRDMPGVHALVWVLSFISFFFLYPSTFNILEVAAVDKPKLHMWETGIMRITRHPQMVGQGLWCAAHTLWVGSSFMAVTTACLMAHHLFAVWHGDRRLQHKYGEAFEVVKARTSVLPFAAIADGRQQLPPDYYKEFLRAPYITITALTLGAYFAHPIMQAASFGLKW